MALVLCTGVDPVLLETRRLILQQAGHTVTTVMLTDEPALTIACQKQLFDVVVIGQTIPVRLKKVIVSLLHEYCPTAKILELYQPHHGKILQNADAWMEVPADVPRDLARRVNELVKTQKGNEGSA